MCINVWWIAEPSRKIPKFWLSNGISDMYRRHNNQSIWTSDEHRLAEELLRDTRCSHTNAPVQYSIYIVYNMERKI